MKPEDEVVVLRADRENLHQRVRELSMENDRLRERLGPRGLETVMIGDAGHYVSGAVKGEIESLRVQLATEKEITENLAWAVEQSNALCAAHSAGQRPTDPHSPGSQREV